MTDQQMDPREIVALSAASKVTSFMDPSVWGQMKSMAETLRQSGMLPKQLDSVPKILVVMQTGFENGLKPMESFNSLYVVNGTCNYWGKAVTRRFREHGWKITYENETTSSVTAVATNSKDEKEVYRETYTFDEAVKSGYTKDHSGNLKIGWKEGYNRRLKLRYGALNIIIKSYIPEILGSVNGIVEVDEDAQVIEAEEGEVIQPTTPAKPVKSSTSIDDFMDQQPKAAATPTQSVDRVKLQKRYFALVKENGTDHQTIKELFGFAHLEDLTDKQLIDIVGKLSKNVSVDSK